MSEDFRESGLSEEPLDTVVRLITPERIVFEYPLGGPFRRFSAYLLDLMILVALVVVAFLLSLLFTVGSIAGLGPALVVYFLLSWGYGAFCEGVFNGQTPGKRVLGLRVVSERGVPITGAQAILRNLVGAVDGMVPFFYMLGLTCMFLTRRFQRLGDLAAGTMVVVEERRARPGLVRIREPAVEAVLAKLPVRIAGGSDLARVLSDYVQRRHRFSRPFRESLAEPLARPLRARFGLPPQDAADSVLCAVYHRVFLGE